MRCRCILLLYSRRTITILTLKPLSMEIKTFATQEYKGAKIYVRNWEKHWEYLTVFDGEIYTAHISVAPRFIRSVLYSLRVVAFPYTKEESDGAYKYMVKTAESTIDFLLKDKK